MNADLIVRNVAAHWIQAGVLATSALIAIRLMNVNMPRARLAKLSKAKDSGALLAALGGTAASTAEALAFMSSHAVSTPVVVDVTVVVGQQPDIVRAELQHDVGVGQPELADVAALVPDAPHEPDRIATQLLEVARRFVAAGDLRRVREHGGGVGHGPTIRRSAPHSSPSTCCG